MSSSISLTNAVTSGDETAVRALLTNGADVNERTSGGQTALILAVIFGHTNLIQLLVNAGADPQLRDNLGLNAIEWAKRRGLTEAIDILTNGPGSGAPSRRIVVEIEQPPARTVEPQPKPETETREPLSDDEKSRRWIAGLKQRLLEQELRRLNRNEPPDGASVEAVNAAELPGPEPPKPEPVKTEPVRPEPVKPEQVKPEPVRVEPAPARILEPPKSPSPSSSNRKRCPKCNAIYNGDLVSYCAHHIVPLVDANEPIVSEPPRANPPLFWIMIIITLTGSIVVGSLITTYLFESSRAADQTAAAQQTNIQKGVPELGGELVGKALSLPEAECPVNGPEPVLGTVIVRVMVDKKGQVYWARGSGGDWLMRGAATEAAMKSTFAPEKLRGREAEGTITYTFK